MFVVICGARVLLCHSTLKSIRLSFESESVHLPSFINELDSHISRTLQSLKQRLFKFLLSMS